MYIRTQRALAVGVSGLDAYNQYLTRLLAEFIVQVEKEYYELYLEIDATFDENNSPSERSNHSVKLAQLSGVLEDRIVKSRKDLDDLFG